MDRKEFAIRARAAGCRRFCSSWSTWQSELKEEWRWGDRRGCSGNSSLFVLFLNITKPEEFIKAFVAATMAAEKVPVMIVDEANIAFPNGNGGNGNGRREAAYRALATFVALTKEQGKASVILVASDYAFPLGLQALGFNKYDALNTIVAPEVEEKPMLFLLQEWGLSQDLAQELWATLHSAFLKLAFVSSCSCKTGSNFGVLCFAEFLVISLSRDAWVGTVCVQYHVKSEYGKCFCVVGWQEFYETFGGNVFLCHQAVDKLREQFELGQERLFDPFNVRGNAGLDDLIGDPLTRKHMENLAQKGWSQVEGGAAEAETESQKGARIIAKKNFGAIIERQTTTFFDEALKEDMFRDPDAVRVLIPPTTYARKCIQRMVDTVKPSNLDFKERLFFWSNLSSLWAPVILQFNCFSIFQEHLSDTRTIFSPSVLGWTCWTQGITRPQAGAVWVRQLKEDRSDRCQ